MSYESATSAVRGPNFLAPLEAGALGTHVLMPGDPDRVDLMASLWDDAKHMDLPRGFRAAVGTHRGVPVAALSSGMGGGSLEIVLQNAAELGVRTVIRVGTTGALQREIDCGHLVINEGAVRLDGTSSAYVPLEYPAVAAHHVTAALVAAAQKLGAPYHLGIGATTASFYAGQARPGFGDYLPASSAQKVAELQKAGVTNLEMEAATLFAIGRVLGLQTGAVCSVIANRVTDQWGDEGGIERACRVATEALAMLREQDDSQSESAPR